MGYRQSDSSLCIVLLVFRISCAIEELALPMRCAQEVANFVGFSDFMKIRHGAHGWVVFIQIELGIERIRYGKVN